MICLEKPLKKIKVMVMAWNDWIAKHPKIVLAAWIVLILIMAPLAGKLSELTDYSTEQMVSHEIESIKVQDIMSEEFSKAQNPNMTYLLITNITVNNENARKAYYSFKNRVEGKYASNVTSYYDALDMLWDMDYELTLNITRMTANMTGVLYRSVKGAQDGYGTLLNQLLLLKNTTDTMKTSLVATAQGGYLALKSNLTSIYTQLNMTSGLLQMADGIYVQLCTQNPNMTTPERTQALQNELIAKLPESQWAIVPEVVQAVTSADPYCTGTLLSDKGLLENTTVELVYGMITSAGTSFPFEIPKEVLFQLYESGGDETAIDTMAQNMLKAQIAEQMNGLAPSPPEALADIIVSEVAKDPYGGVVSGEKLEDATVRVVLALSPQKTEETEKIVRELYSGADPRELAKELFMRGGMQEQMKNQTIPEEFAGVINDLIEQVIQNYPMSEEELEELVKDTVKSLVSDYAKNNPYGGVELNFDQNLLVDIAFKFKDNPEAITREDVRPLAEELWPVFREKAGTYLSMLKSDDNTTLLITFVPFGRPGPSGDEFKYLAQNATEVKKIALEEFGKYFPDVKGALGGYTRPDARDDGVWREGQPKDEPGEYCWRAHCALHTDGWGPAGYVPSLHRCRHLCTHGPRNSLPPGQGRLLEHRKLGGDADHNDRPRSWN